MKKVILPKVKEKSLSKNDYRELFSQINGKMSERLQNFEQGGTVEVAMQFGDVLRETFQGDTRRGTTKMYGNTAPNFGGYLKETAQYEQGGEHDINKLLTGEVIQGLGEKSGVEANAELEGKEYIKFPDGETQKIVGESHTDGGVDMQIPDGTRILSEKRKLSKEQARDITRDYGIKVTTKNSYAEAVDIYVKKIGLKKLYDEQEDIFKELERVIKGSDSETEGTRRVNQQYLSKKIHNIELQKQEKEPLKTKIFDTLFTMQEVSKRPEEKEEVEQFFAEGGMSRETFRKVVNKYGLSEKEGIELYKGKVPERITKPKFDEGGEKGKIPRTLDEVQKMYEAGEITRQQADQYEVELVDIAKDEVETPAEEDLKFTTALGENKFSDTGVYQQVEQHATESGFGEVTKENIDQVIAALYRNFPDIVAEEFSIKFNDDGGIEFDKGINFKAASDKVKSFQERADNRMRATAGIVQANPEQFSPEYVQLVGKYLEDETFDGSLARKKEGMLGNFTAGRRGLSLDMVTDKELKELQSKNIYTSKQLQTAIDEGTVELSQSSLDRIEKIRAITPPDSDADFVLETYEPGEAAPEIPEPKAEKEDVFIVDDIVVPEKQYPTLFHMPDMSPIPPSGMEAHLMGDNRFQRIDPVRVGVETELQQAGDALKFGTKSLEHLPPNQRAAAIVGLQANVQRGMNEAIHKANIVNAQNESAAELFNIGQAGQESQMRTNNLLSFEQRQLTAKAKTEEEVRNYYDQLNRIKLNNYRNQQDLNFLQSLTPDYSISRGVNGINYTPDGEFKTKDNSKLKGII